MAETNEKKAKKAKGPNIFKRLGKYFRDLVGEMKKIVWPSKKQTINNTIIVIVVVIVAAAIIVSLDAAFGGLIKLLLSLAQ